ncbi:protein snakeskin isoform X2 [Galleria mellonella]|uniref:Protein snakeskin isoform X2 n=1 Tax=Galleria mellonella TaxID=7137 RepID=A0A6J3BZ60_GALME|nr:protein snakeskin isoform X2 [Galleria mellonella]
MVSIQTIGTIVVKSFKIVLNIIILVLYRTGYNGEFLGVGGTWNLNEEKNPDAEIVASGVIVGYLIYTLVQVVTYLFGTTEHKSGVRGPYRALSDIVMNFVGVFLWIAVGAVALHYWGGYQGEQQYHFVYSEKQVGLAVGALCVIQGAVYLLDTALSVIHFTKEM